MKAWIDFRELRTKLSFEDVLRKYGVEVKKKGTQHHGYCPLPNHNGKKNSPSFSANLEKGIFKCFGCGAKGNVLDFAAFMEKTDPENGQALRDVALKLQKEFKLGNAKDEKREKPEAEPELFPERKDKTSHVNAPLNFELKGLDPKHPYLLGRGFIPKTIQHFGLGFCSRGMLKDRIAIPLHDSRGILIGYAGRVVDDSKIAEDNPRYRFPGEREHKGERFEFRKTLFLYNGFRIKGPLDDLIVVEGFASVWWLTQSGLQGVVATMGPDCSDKQTELILSGVKHGGRVWIISDGDPAGERFALSLLTKVSLHRFVRWIKLSEGRQPTDMTSEQLKSCLIL